MGQQRIFNHPRVDVVAAADDEVLGPAGEVDEPANVDAAEVAGVQPAVADDAVPAGPGRRDEADLLALAAPPLAEPAARPKRIYPVDAIPVTEVGKQFKPALIADAAVRAITEALAAAGLPDARATAAHEDGRLVVTVTGADPDRVRDAVAGFALTVRSGPSPAPQTAMT